MWVSARGETETYASPVLQGLLESETGQPALFSPEILQRAKEAALKAPPELKVSEISLEHIRKPQPRVEALHVASPIDSDSRSALSAKAPLGSCSPDQHDSEPGGKTEAETSLIERPPSVEGLVPASSSSDCSMDEPSPFLNGDSTLSSHLPLQSELRLSPKNYHLGPPADLSPVCPAAREEGAGYPSQDDSNGFAQNFAISRTAVETSALERKDAEGNIVDYMLQNDIPKTTSESVNLETSIPFEASNEEAIASESKDQELNQNSQPDKFMLSRDNPTTDSPRIISFSSPLSIASFLESKFRQLQQNTCKLVCKAWIKVVEPKKQRKFPYRSGDASKPDWWPRGVVHREPDHLLKPDRIKLMLAVLGAGKVPVGRLELASAEMAAFIPPDKMNILQDIYTVTKEEERLRTTWPAGVSFVPFQVELSNNNLSEAPSKSSGSPQTMNSEILAGSPAMIDYMPNIQHTGEVAINFMSGIPSEPCHREDWAPSGLSGYVQSNLKAQSFSHEKMNCFLSGEYNPYNVHDMMSECNKSWAMNSEMYQEPIAPTSHQINTIRRSGRAEGNLVENLEAFNQGTPATNAYSFPHSIQTSFSSELLGSSIDGGASSRNGSTSNQPPHDSGFFQQEFSAPENAAWANCGMFFESPVGTDSTENLWRNVSIPSASFESSKVLSEESYLL
ncbi:hypothetical protein PCASD_00797 [Puccinia coronata f. sp. avenae]|uniref:Subtelomeric hrmA-associated cluster protein AFUB-079030/YDR124W-like helical bundle domain-containing protein n=2 Tax=Puccinia coronata f. sp. avenae TaxID=200324 RepID=A0A2N5VPF9_9BASI|nr:hypothetical protein PCASD_00797 [Puccinia coronata f. sp. avenae]